MFMLLAGKLNRIYSDDVRTADKIRINSDLMLSPVSILSE